PATHAAYARAKTARAPDKRIRDDTARVLGMLRAPSAVKIVAVLRFDPEPLVRQDASEALWRLGDDRGLQDLIGLSVSRYPDDRMLAMLGLASAHDTRVREHIRANLTNEYPEVAVVAARALGMLGSDNGYGVALDTSRSVDRY